MKIKAILGGVAATVGAVALLAACSAGGGSDTAEAVKTSDEATPAAVVETSEASSESYYEQAKDKLAAEPVEEPEAPAETVSQENARLSAESYLDTMAFSRAGLIDQLKFEGFSKKDATYAVDVINPDWNEHAAQTAQDYLDTMPFSRSSLIDQLIFEGYTEKQAIYGVDQTGL